MTNQFSTPMVFSSDDMAYTTAPALPTVQDKVPAGFNGCRDVRDFRRSRFDEVESYKEVGHVGSGGFGNCLLLQKKSNMTLRVCKIQRRSKRVSQSIEVGILRDILYDHPRIIRLHEAIMHANTMQLYFDYYPGGDLYGVMAHYFDICEPVPESFLWHCLLQISEGLAFIHHGYDRRQLCGPPPSSEWQPIIHGDIKPENIFLGPPTPDSHGYPSLVLGDFGLATIHEVPVAGTWMWQPPELPITSGKADVWALGAIIHSMAHDGDGPLRQCPPWMAPNNFFRWPEARAPMPLPGHFSAELHNLVIHGTLAINPMARYSSLQVLQCAIDEIQLGVASDMTWEPLIDPGFSGKTYDENGVTENTTASSDDDFHEVEPMVYCEPVHSS